MMTPNLIDTTREYWKKLDELEAAYQRDEISVQEVNSRVQKLMQDLGQSRRASLRSLWTGIQRNLNQSWETVAGLVCITGLTYAWFVMS
ncbi:MAG: hypothetical protein WBA57_03060 [Elainellaceae cyanobacterium]